MSEHAQLPVIAAVLTAPTKENRKTEPAADVQRHSFKRRIDCEETRDRSPDPTHQKRNGRGGRRRSDKPSI
jgi:hypothetical protein